MKIWYVVYNDGTFKQDRIIASCLEKEDAQKISLALNCQSTSEKSEYAFTDRFP